MKSRVPDLSVSVPMTVSDLETRDTRGPVFSCGTQYNAHEYDEIRQVTHAKEGVFL